MTRSSCARAFHDRLHEQYRAGDAPLLGAIRASATDGAVGVTLSGSGPSVVVWAAHDRAAGVAAELRETLPDDTRVLAAASGPERSQARMSPYGKHRIRPSATAQPSPTASTARRPARC